MPEEKSASRHIRVFVSSTFRDMVEDRDALMSHAWPELRRFCRERHVELVEVDLRWGITEEQGTRRETLKLCLDEIRACRPYFIGLLGERYGWVPDGEAFTPDLLEEQRWLDALRNRSVTELEILHGVLNDPDMAGRAFFYFRDPAWAESRGADFLPENADAAARQSDLKERIRDACREKGIPLHEDYADPATLAALVLADLQAAIEAEFPLEEAPDALAREALGHEAFAELRRRAYIGRETYFETLDRHAVGTGGPLLLTGDSGGGKSALLANWAVRWHEVHPEDFLLLHHVGGAADSASHWRLMERVIGEIRRWTGDPDPAPVKREDILRDFPLWLAKARAHATHRGLRFILVLDALNQLADEDHARLLGWLPQHPFTGPLRLVASTLPGAALDAARQRSWEELRVEPLTVEERRRMITAYLERFGKKLDAPRLERLAGAAPADNPLYLKILLDELRVTGTHDRLDERLDAYLASPDIPALLRQVLARWQRDYERDRPGLVGEALGLVFSARRGLAETELLQLLAPKSEARNPSSATPQLPPALWSPLRAALEDSLVERGGILDFAHDFLREAVGVAFVPDLDARDEFQLRLADYFEALHATTRTCDELPWLLKETESFSRLRACLLEIDHFLLIRERDEEELRHYWMGLGEERTMGADYLSSFEAWSRVPGSTEQNIVLGANDLAYFLSEAALHGEAEPLMRRALAICEVRLGEDHPDVAGTLNNLALLLQATNRLAEAEPLYRRALVILEASYGRGHPKVATGLNNLALLLQATNRWAEAEALMRRAQAIDEASYGEGHPKVATSLNNLAMLLQATNRLAEAESLYRRSLAIDEGSFGKDHPDVATDLNNLAELLRATNRLAEAEPLYRRALVIFEASCGGDHPKVASVLNNLAMLLQATNRLAEAEPLHRRALAIDEASYGESHPDVATDLNNLAELLRATNRLAEAEPLMRRALAINEGSFGKDHPDLGRDLNNLGGVLYANNRLAEAELIYLRALTIDEASFGEDHPDVARDLNNLAEVFRATNRPAEAEPLFRRALAIWEASFGGNHPKAASAMNNLALALKDTNRLAEAEPLMRRVVEIFLQLTRITGQVHPHLRTVVNNYGTLLQEMGWSEMQIQTALEDTTKRFGMFLDKDGGGRNRELPPQLDAVMEPLMNDPSQLPGIITRLQREDPALLGELLEWLQRQHP